ncbi:MAG: IMP dehydrogenase, partial [Patescibacteria group bacterium]
MPEGLTFDDLLLEPRYSTVRPSQVNLATRLTRRVPLNLPIVSSPMDTVTEHKMAIAMAAAGGIGIIHKNLSPEDQAEEVAKVKRWENGFIEDPITLTPEDSIDDAEAIRDRLGYKKFPIVDKKGKLVGMLTGLDYNLPDDAGVPV